MDGIKALTFDTGGTILDWHSGVKAALAAAGARRGVAADWTAVTNAKGYKVYRVVGGASPPRLIAELVGVDTLTVRDYRIQLIAFVTAYDRVSGKNLVNREFVGRTLVRTGADQSSAERQALPLLTEDLARNITSAIADGEW